MNKLAEANLLLENSRANVSGVLNVKTITALRAKGEKLLATKDVLEFDFSAVSRSDSAGLALLIALFRAAQQKKKTITFTHLPKQLYDIAKVSGLEKILPIINEIQETKNTRQETAQQIH